MTLKQIDDLCDQFETVLRVGESARIEDYLLYISEDQRPQLLRELISIEVEFACGVKQDEEFSGRFPAPVFRLQKSLKERFPEQKEWIDTVAEQAIRSRQIGDYEILDEIGFGGMGIVYKARQKLLNQTVAIKVLAQSLLDDPLAVGRFRREMQLIGALNHPNIVRALNAGEVDGSHYLVMEFVDGITLQRLCDIIRKSRMSQGQVENSGLIDEDDESFCAAHTVASILKDADHTTTQQSKKSSVVDVEQTVDHRHSSLFGNKTPAADSKKHSSAKAEPAPIPILSVGAACEAVRQAAMGLSHADRFGLVHRDIKPANLMLDRYGTVKILDLGLGKFMADKKDSMESSLTVAGTTIGTIDYISPEQCENAGDADIRSDIYSLGCSLYFILVGTPPYAGSRYDTSRKKLMAHIVGEVPDLRKVLKDIPNELQKILEQMVAKDPRERFQTPLQLAEALEPLSSPEELREWAECILDGSRFGRYGSTDHLSNRTTMRPLKKKQGNSLGFPSYQGTLLILLLLCLFTVFVRFLPWVQAERKPVEVTSTISQDRRQVQTDLALLPGLNGAWWFDEIPWLLPVVREKLLQRIDAAEDWTTILGPDPQRYYDPNIPEVYDWIWDMVQQVNKGQNESDRILVDKIKAFYEADFDAAGAEQAYVEFINLFVTARPSDMTAWSGTEIHTLALLEHRLALLRNNRTQAEEASLRYSEALARYRYQHQRFAQPNASTNANTHGNSADEQCAQRCRLFEYLCLSDAARLEYFATGNYAKTIRKYEEVTQQRASGERLGPLFLSELYAARASFAAQAGQYDDSLFIRGLEMLNRSKVGQRMHPLVAQLSERYAWSLLEQWKLAESEKQFKEGLLIREVNRRETKNPYASIYVLHDRHGQAMTIRYQGNITTATREYRRTIEDIDQLLQDCRAGLFHTSDSQFVGLRRYHAALRERAANSRERLADCVLYGGAASGTFGPGRLAEAAKWYDEAAQLYIDESSWRIMKAKQAIMLLLQNKIVEAERILSELDEKKQSLMGNQIRAELIRQVADALLSFKKEPEKGHALLRQFLRQFNIPTNPASVAAVQREVLELRFFCGEFLVTANLEHKKYNELGQDLSFLLQPYGFLGNSPQARPFLKRFTDLFVKGSVALYHETPPDSPLRQALLEQVVRILEAIRLNRHADDDAKPIVVGSHAPTNVVFFLTDKKEEGFVLIYPQEDGQNAEYYPLALTRTQVKEGYSQKEITFKLDEKIVQSIQKIQANGSPIRISWNDETCWANKSDALLDSDWPFGDQLKLIAGD